jgi:hypothetical protein
MSRVDFDPSFFPFQATIGQGADVSPQGGVLPTGLPTTTAYPVGIQRSASKSTIVREDAALPGQLGGSLRQSVTTWDVFFNVLPPVETGNTLLIDDGRKFNALGPPADGGDGVFNLWLVQCEEIG